MLIGETGILRILTVKFYTDICYFNKDFSHTLLYLTVFPGLISLINCKRYFNPQEESFS